MKKTNNQQLKTNNLQPRPPIVVVMGHVDHGKTSLLDYIRKTTVTTKEAGGITQSIGAYEIEHSGKKITFIDTPGHEAFSKMRARGANIADLAILVVAADDGVKPQTKESIEILNSSKTPFIAAINKIDKPNADIERVKNDLMNIGVLLEGYGGNVSWQAISAKTGEGVNELLDLILLAAEMENFTYDPTQQANGVIIESKINSQRGIIAVAVVKNGTLKIGDEISTPSATGKIKNLRNFLKKPVKELTPSSPALILGFEALPQIGEEFQCGVPSSSMATSIKPVKKEEKALVAENLPKQKTINLILKADVSGTLEALSEIIKSLPTDEIKIKIIDEAVGEITDGDVKRAQPTNAIIVGFKTETTKAAENLARSQQLKIITSEIIYELVKKIEEELENLKSPKPLGELEVLALFSQKGLSAGRQGKRQLIGGKVISGAIKNKSRVKILRDNAEIGFGKITNLQSQKKNVNQVNEGEECGIMLESDIVIKVGDYLIHQL